MLRLVFRPSASLSRLAAERRIIGACPPSSLLLRRLLRTPPPTSTSPTAQTSPIDSPSTPQTQRTTTFESLLAARTEGPRERAVTAEGRREFQRPEDPAVISSPTYAHLGSLPPNTTKVDIVKAMMAAGPTGRILALTLTPPEQGRYSTYAQASIEFDSFHSADRLFKLNRDNLFLVNGVRPYVTLQVKKGAPDPGLDIGPSRQHSDEYKIKVPPSRVLVIKGRPDDPRMQVKEIRRVLVDHCVPLETENIEVKDYTLNGRRIIIWRFCSWRYQTRRAIKVLRTVTAHDFGRFGPIGIYYGHDPCGFGETNSATYPKENVEYRSIL